MRVVSCKRLTGTQPFFLCPDVCLILDAETSRVGWEPGEQLALRVRRLSRLKRSGVHRRGYRDEEGRQPLVRRGRAKAEAEAHRGEAPGRFTRGHRGATDTDEGESVEDKNARGPVWFRVGVVRRPPSLVRPRNCKNWEGTPRALPRGGLIMAENRQAPRPLRTATGRRACTTETA